VRLTVWRHFTFLFEPNRWSQFLNAIGKGKLSYIWEALYILLSFVCCFQIFVCSLLAVALCSLSDFCLPNICTLRVAHHVLWFCSFLFYAMVYKIVVNCFIFRWLRFMLSLAWSNITG
jgi:hypothetical protein